MSSYELLSARWVNKSQFTILLYFVCFPSDALLRVTFCVIISFFFQIKGTTVYRKFELHVPMNPVMILT